MSLYLSIIQVVVSIVLICAILLQSRGTGLSGAFGGEGAVYRTRRGIEKSLFVITIVAGAIFLITSFLNILTR